MTTEAKKRANKKWRESHRDHIAQKQREKYHQDPAHREYIQRYNLERYHIKKETLLVFQISPEIFY
jgi:hypothetical protein